MANIQISNRNFYIPEKDSPCDTWKMYWKQLRKAVGQDNAQIIWLLTWKETGAISCTTKPGFQRWLKQHNLDVSNAATRTVADLSQIGQNFFGLGKRLTNILSIGVPIALAGGLIIILIILVNTAKRTDIEGLGQALTPSSKMAVLAKSI